LIRFCRYNGFLGRDDFPNSRQTGNKIPHPVPKFFESRFLGSSQIPNPVKIFFVFPNPAPYFGQIPDPENTLPDPVSGGAVYYAVQGESNV